VKGTYSWPSRPLAGAMTALGITAALLVAVPAPEATAAVDGTVWTVGAGVNGQLGYGGTADRTAFGPTTGLPDVTAVSGGREHALALSADGHVWAWGDNVDGQIGNGTHNDALVPVQVPGISGAVQVAAGHYHSLALLGDGTVRAWGLNTGGQLGDGTTTNRLSPVPVSGLTGVLEVSGGRDLSIALKADGTVWAWGLNGNGQLGDGTTTNRTRPVRVGNLGGVVHVAAGRDHGLAVASDGTVWSWGLNSSGQLGDGTTTQRTSPVQVVGVSGAVEVAAGADHSIALLSDGRVETWGENSRAELGTGSGPDRTLAAVVGGLPPVASIDAGRDHTLAVTTSGTLWVWGFDDSGQLGDGSTTNKAVPEQVAGITDAVEAGGGRNYSVLLRSSAQPPPDTTPPTVPGTPTGTSTVSGRIDLSWVASTDDRATSITYAVYRDGVGPVGTVTSSSTTTVPFADTGLAAGSTHVYAVTASDGTNTSDPSPQSAPITVASGSPTLFSDDFGNGLAAWTVTNVTLDQTLAPPTGSVPSARVSPSGQAAYAQHPLPVPQPRVCLSVQTRVGTLQPSGTVALLKLRTPAGASVGRVFLTAADALSVRADVPGTTFNTTSTLPVGTWHQVTLCVTTGTGGGMSLSLDGSQVGAWTVATGTNALGVLQLGDDSARTVTVNYDDVVATS